MRRRWLEPGILGLLSATAAALWIFVAIAGEMVEGETSALDMAVLLALRVDGHPELLLGPPWLQEFARDITGLGSPGVLGLVVATSAVFMVLCRRYRTALFLILATSADSLLNSLLKLYFSRPRPVLVPRDMHLSSFSFPSGHAMASTTVYLTLAAILVQMSPNPRSKLFVLCVAVMLSALVGISRVYLGVHWPSDVLAGWAVGAAWALAAWGVARAFHLDNGPRP